jgi:uncharacterized membrane protein
MHSRARFLGHSIHQQLIVFPLGLLSAAVIFDIVHLVISNPTMAVVAFWMLVSGVIGGLVAAPFGWIDWLAIPQGTRAKAIGLTHGVSNVTAIFFFIVSAGLRWQDAENPQLWAHITSFAGLLFALLGGWLGGELVSRLGVGVYDGAHLNSPNSLSGRPAQEEANFDRS